MWEEKSQVKPTFTFHLFSCGKQVEDERPNPMPCGHALQPVHPIYNHQVLVAGEKHG